MKGVVIDIETTTGIEDRNDISNLELSICGCYDYETDEYNTYTVEELDQLWQKIQKAGFIIGYNSIFFDLPILQKYTDINLGEIKHFDILREIRKVLGRRIPLNWVAQGTLGEVKSGSGLDAVKWWKEGEIEKIKKYCIKDVEITKKIFDEIINKQNLKYTDNTITFNIKMDISIDEYVPKIQNASLFD